MAVADGQPFDPPVMDEACRPREPEAQGGSDVLRLAVVETLDRYGGT
jgi:hypothetical protein